MQEQLKGEGGGALQLRARGRKVEGGGGGGLGFKGFRKAWFNGVPQHGNRSALRNGAERGVKATKKSNSRKILSNIFLICRRSRKGSGKHAGVR